MKKFNFSFALLIAVFFSFSIAVKAQKTSEDNSPPASQNDRPVKRNLLLELDLSTDQVRQIKMLNVQRKPVRQQARKRLQVANQSLDQAIYADTVDEAAIQTLLREVQAAQIELIQVRATDELEVRKILTSDQLTKFRELRRQIKDQIKQNRQADVKNFNAPTSNPKKRPNF